MGLNLAEIQQKLDRLIQNMSEQNRRAYQIFYDPTPQDVELPQLDENGNLVNVTIPNRALIKKQMWDDVGKAVGYWYRYLWVDPVNGDDNNPGTSTAPLKTVNKAVDTVPFGGGARVYLVPSAKYVIDSQIVAEGKHIFISTDPTSLANGVKATLTGLSTVVSLGNSTVNTLYGIQTTGTLRFGWLNIEVPSVQDSTFPLHPLYRSIAVAAYNSKYGGGVIGFHYCTITTNSGFSLIDCYNYGGKTDLLNIVLWGNKVTVNDTSTYLINTQSAATALYSSSNSFVDSAGNALNIVDLVGQIVKDANGVPRSVVSNLIF